MTQQPPKPARCPHGGNPVACPICYQLNLKMKAKQPTAPRTSLDPQITQGKTVSAQNNPVAAHLMAKKEAAMNAVATKVGANPQLVAAQAAPVPDAPKPTRPSAYSSVQQNDFNPHMGGAVPDDAPQAEGIEGAGVFIDVAQLEQMFPKHASIIDRQPTHPEGHVSGRGTVAPGRGGGGSRAPVTKGRMPR